MNRETVVLSTTSDFSGWRAWSRKLLHERVAADSIRWIIKNPADLYAPSATRVLPAAPSTTSVPRSLAALFPAVFVSEAPERFRLLYITLQTLRDNLPVPDELAERLTGLATESRKRVLDLRCQMPDARNPDWQVVRTFHASALIDSQAAALADLRPAPWVITAPERTLCWNGQEHLFGPGLEGDISNSSEVIAAARNIATAGAGNGWWHGIAPVRLHPDATDIASSSSLPGLRGKAIDCRMCDLCGPATRTVSGEGNPAARIIFVGEQPGDQEDLQGRPFVGPAGQLLDRALKEAGGNRAQAWITNAVKHFKFVPKGNRRIHQNRMRQK